MADWRTANNSLRAARDAMDDHKRREHLANRNIGTFHHLGEIRLPHVEKLMDLQTVTDSTVMAQLANGKTYILTDAWTEGAFEVETAEGKFGAKFFGMSMQEI